MTNETAKVKNWQLSEKGAGLLNEVIATLYYYENHGTADGSPARKMIEKLSAGPWMPSKEEQDAITALIEAARAAVIVLEEPLASDTRELSFKLVDVAQLLTQLRSALEKARL